MTPSFYQHIWKKHQQTGSIPTNETIANWAIQLIRLLYPQKAKTAYKNAEQIKETLNLSKTSLLDILKSTKACEGCNNQEIVDKFFQNLPVLYEFLNKDAEAILEGDPAAVNQFEVVRTYPGFFAICFYRIAHALLRLNVPLIPRILTEHAHSKTGIDIHPAAEIGDYFFIDHGTGIVIGETSKIGDRVKLYQGVNLGGLSVSKDMQNEKRHPTVEDDVVIYSGATILGGETTIGHHSIIGGNAWLLKGVPPYSKVFNKPSIDVIENSVEQSD